MTVDIATTPIVEAASTPSRVPQDRPFAKDISSLKEEIKGEIHEMLQAFLGDVEFRLSQNREVESRIAGNGPNKFYAEDLVIGKHQITGYVVTNNSPVAGSIAWSSLHVVYNGVDYTITNGNTALKYVWFDGAVSTSVLQSSNTKPTLVGNACLLFINNGGTVIEVLNASMPPVVANAAVDSGALQAGSVLTAAIADGQITEAKTTFYTSLAAAVTAAQNKADQAQATADGSIATYFQAAAPWANGTTQDVAKVGDVWYDSDDGQAYRWSGAAGSPVNTWVAIEDSNIGAALAAANNAQAKADIKTTTYYANLATPPTAPTAPAGNGFTVGDFWVVTDQGNLIKRWSGSAWVDLTVGTNALANGAVTDAKVGTGISGTKLANGTVGDTQLGTGISGAKLTAGSVTDTQIGGVSGTKIAGGTVGATQLGSGAVTPVKLNVLQHILY